MRPCAMGRTVDCKTMIWTAASEITMACLKSPLPVGCRTTARFIPLDTTNTAPVVRRDFFAHAIFCPNVMSHIHWRGLRGADQRLNFWILSIIFNFAHIAYHSWGMYPSRPRNFAHRFAVYLVPYILRGGFLKPLIRGQLHIWSCSRHRPQIKPFGGLDTDHQTVDCLQFG